MLTHKHQFDPSKDAFVDKLRGFLSQNKLKNLGREMCHRQNDFRPDERTMSHLLRVFPALL